MPLEMNKAGWDQLLKGIVRDHLSPRAERIAAACNDDLRADMPEWASEGAQADGGYRAGTEGDPAEQLHKRDYHATVITANYEAMHDNAVHNTLVNNLALGEGQ